MTMNLNDFLRTGLACGSLLLLACGDDSTEAVDGGDDTTGGTTMVTDTNVTLTTMTTSPTDPTDPTDPTTTDTTTGGETSGEDDTGEDTTGDTTDGTTGDTTDGTTGDETGDETDGTTGGDELFFQVCFLDAEEACQEGEVCLYGTFGDLFAEVTFCSTSECSDVDDCPPQPGGGDAPTICEPLSGGETNFCLIDCSNGETCPDGMQCFNDSVCGHPSPWTCNVNYYDAGEEDGCDCGCGIVDPDCDDMTLSSCDYCDNTGSCSDDDCDGNTDIDPDDNAVCE
jgi:hypothetical protein